MLIAAVYMCGQLGDNACLELFYAFLKCVFFVNYRAGLSLNRHNCIVFSVISENTFTFKKTNLALKKAVGVIMQYSRHAIP